jgi:hypothetical protein
VSIDKTPQLKTKTTSTFLSTDVDAPTVDRSVKPTTTTTTTNGHEKEKSKKKDLVKKIIYFKYYTKQKSFAVSIKNNLEGLKLKLSVDRQVVLVYANPHFYLRK